MAIALWALSTEGAITTLKCIFLYTTVGSDYLYTEGNPGSWNLLKQLALDGAFN